MWRYTAMAMGLWERTVTEANSITSSRSIPQPASLLTVTDPR